MSTTNDISAELKSMGSPLAGMPRTMPYHVPADYFEGFAGNIDQTIAAISIPDTVPAWSKAMPYAVGEHYFEQLTGKIVSAAIEQQYFVSDILPKDMPLTAPSGYFKALPAQILAAVKAPEKGNTIPLKRRINIQLQWAAAAMFIVFISIGSYITFTSKPQGSASEQMLASVPATEIQDYLQHTYRLDVDRIENSAVISNLQVDDKEIIRYLNETGWDATE